jgi:hypothetical protein
MEACGLVSTSILKLGERRVGPTQLHLSLSNNRRRGHFWRIDDSHHTLMFVELLDAADHE